MSELTTKDSSTLYDWLTFDVVASIALTIGVIVAFAWWQRIEYKEKVRQEALRKKRDAYIKKMKLESRAWTEKEMSVYDGKDEEKPIVLAAKGKVYNVWRGRGFYGEECAYHFLAGKDASRSLAKELLEPESVEDEKKPLTTYELDQLDEWIEHYQWKYEVIGTLRGWSSDVLHRPQYIKTNDGKNSDDKNSDGKNSDGKNSDGKNSDGKNSDGKNSDDMTNNDMINDEKINKDMTNDGRNNDDKDNDDRNNDDGNNDDKNNDDRNNDDRNSDDRNSDDRNSDDRNTDDRNTDDRNTDERNTDERNTDERNTNDINNNDKTD